MTIRLGTRGSALALAQARWVAERLDGEVELVPIRTAGDERRGGDQGQVPQQGPLRKGDRGGAARRARSTSRFTPRRTCPASCPTGSASSGCRSEPTRVTHSVAPARSPSSPTAPSSAPRASAGAPRCSRCAPTCDPRAAWKRRHAAAPARGGDYRRDRAGARRASPGSAASDDGVPLDELVPAPGQGCLALEARDERHEGGRRGRRAHRHGRAQRPDRRASAGRRARRHLQHADGRPRRTARRARCG